MGKIIYEVHSFESNPTSFTLHKNVSGKTDCFYSNCHPEIEIIYIVSGSGTVCINNDTYTAKAGDIVVVNSGQIHTGIGETWKYHVIIPSNDFLDSFGIKLPFYTFSPLIRDEKLSALFLAVMHESDCPGEFQNVLMRIAAEHFLVALLRDYATNRTTELAKSAAGSELAITARVMNFLSSHFFESFSIDEISESIGITTPYMCHCVKQATGMSIVDHLNMIRCRTAYHYLIHSDKKISEIASLCGFNGRSYFAKVYRQVMGVLPSQVDRTPFLKKTDRAAHS